MVVLDKKLKYLFNFLPKVTEYNEYLDKKVRLDKTLFRTYYYHKKIFDKNGELIKCEIEKPMFVPYDCLTPCDIDEEWELIHLDGNYENYALDNLEPVLFVDENPTKPLYKKIESLEKQIILQNEHIKKITSESKIKDYKVENMNRQVLYEQKRNEELNKEIVKLEKEIKRLFKIIESKKER